MTDPASLNRPALIALCRELQAENAAIALLMSIYFVWVLIFATLRFSDLAAIQGPLLQEDFDADFSFIMFVLLVSFVTEVVTSSIQVATDEPSRRSLRW